ncbi:MAG: dienelactone hydrolase family protein, partial [Saprospiraceae bacterium]|nr:dienelactone hydrolase family protein [Saprospiraceae bacterium]
PDFPAVAHSTIEAVVEYACKQTDLPIFVGGKSFGGRMSSQWMAKNNNSNVAGLVFYGFPLHSPAKPGAERADHLFDIKVPMLFLQGDRDSLARLNLLQPVVDRLPLAELIVFDGANHSFRFLKSMNISEHQAWEKLATATLKFSSTVKKS